MKGIKIDKSKLFKNKSSLDFNRKRKRTKKYHMSGGIILFLQIVVVIAISYVVISGFFIRQTILGDSMAPTLSSGDGVMFDSLTYKFFSPGKNDVIAFQPLNNPKSDYSFKRIVGIPGDTVQIRDGYLYVNGEVYNDVVNTDMIKNPGIAANEILLSDNEYFILGDNRNNSEDSRFSSIGPIKKEDIKGKIWFCYTPGNIGIILD